MKDKKFMKPFGILRSQGKVYLALKPEPLPRDSMWDNGTYMFFVAKTNFNGRYEATHIITNSFTFEYDSNLNPIEVTNLSDREYIPSNEETDLMTPQETVDEITEEHPVIIPHYEEWERRD